MEKRVQKTRSQVGSSVYLIHEVFVHAGVYRRCTSSHASMAPDYKKIAESIAPTINKWLANWAGLKVGEKSNVRQKELADKIEELCLKEGLAYEENSWHDT